MPEDARQQLPLLVELGILEQISRGKGQRLVLSQRFYSFLGKPGKYTRTVGLDRETNKALLLKHLEISPLGAPLAELRQVLPALSPYQVQRLLQELRQSSLVEVRGQNRGARWFGVTRK